jgi:hypothetical protein
MQMIPRFHRAVCDQKSDQIVCVCALEGQIRPAGQAHRKDRTFTRFARHGHVTAHHARELAGDGKPEAGLISGNGCLSGTSMLITRRHSVASFRWSLAG